MNMIFFCDECKVLYKEEIRIIYNKSIDKYYKLCNKHNDFKLCSNFLEISFEMYKKVMLLG